MTEAEWPTCENSTEMLRSLGTEVSDRKLRLFACHCCRSHWNLLTDERSRLAVEMAELWVNDLITDTELEAVESAAEQAKNDILVAHKESDPSVRELYSSAARAVNLIATIGEFGSERCIVVAGDCRMVAYRQSFDSEHPEDYDISLCQIIRDIFGNPFCPVAFSPDWRTETAVALAHTMYESRDFSAMPILADALQDAGCDNEDILAHCRDANQPHVRGCWVVDLVLNKS